MTILGKLCHLFGYEFGVQLLQSCVDGHLVIRMLVMRGHGMVRLGKVCMRIDNVDQTVKVTCNKAKHFGKESQ